jgi:hypothetical protein
MQINGLVLHIYFFTNLYNQLKFIHFDNVILCYFFSLMKPINIFRLLHVKKTYIDNNGGQYDQLTTRTTLLSKLQLQTQIS